MDDDTTTRPWAVEHYGFADDAAATPERPPAASAKDKPGRAATSWMRRGRLAVGGGVLALGLVAGAGGFAVAQAATPDQSVGVVGHPHDESRGPR